VRLTLRTLLAYLDDTLEPLEIKTIGQKVAESETAQELIARIKQVTRRRRITAPPATGPNAFDPNTVAEYLDNELPPEQVAEVEKLCLESDVHLAEVASCHQILTLVLGEPAVVPPKAKERMYALVRGREAIPFRKASSAQASAPTSADADADEMFLLGLPFYRHGGWLRWVLPLVAVLLFTIVGVALWQLIYGIQQSLTPVAQRAPTEASAPEKSSKAPAAPEEKPAAPEPKTAPAAQPTTSQPSPSSAPKPIPPDAKQVPQTKPVPTTPSSPPSGGQVEAKTDIPPSTGKLEKTPAASAASREAPPSKERVVVGQYRISDYAPPSLLVQRSDKDGWMRLKPGSPVTTGDPIMSLPGYASEVQLDCGLHLLLRGHVREFTPLLLVKDQTGHERNEAAIMDYLQESAVVLHKPKDTDADLTLLRGRLYLSNHKKGSEPRGLVVRLRFENKAWDITLYPDAEVLVDLFKTHIPGTSEPLSALKWFLLKGEAGLALEHERYPDLSEPGRAQFSWISLNPSAYERPYLSKQDLEIANRVLFAKRPTVDTPQAREMELALKAIRDRMTVDKDPRTALQETLMNNRFAEHQLALYCLAALDEVKDLLDVLGKADAIYAPDRDTAIFALWRWLDHGKGQREKLFNPETGSGLLRSDLGYTTEEAKRIVDLFREPTDEEIFSTKFYTALAADLASDKVALAELARFWLSRIALGIFHLDLPKLKSFNAALPQDRREAARREVEQAIREGLLPRATGGMPRTNPGR
jgi:cytoskeletal protein RodZ